MDIMSINNKTRFLAIEGVDCSGKGSITDRIVKFGISDIPIKKVSFPVYDLPSGEMIKAYLNGNYGDYESILSTIPTNITPVEWFSIVTSRYERLQKEIEFVMNLYANNRIEYFKTEIIDPNTIYLFDRFSYSNIIHQLAPLYDFLKNGPGAGKIQMEWRNDNIHERLPFIEFLNYYIDTLLENLKNAILDYEYYHDIPKAYTFMLTLRADRILERLMQRKHSNHEGKDIMEREKPIRRTCEFIKDKIDFHRSNGIIDIDVSAFGEDNDKIAEFIIDTYTKAIENQIEPENFRLVL